jgi:hypothetical protein
MKMLQSESCFPIALHKVQFVTFRMPPDNVPAATDTQLRSPILEEELACQLNHTPSLFIGRYAEA